MKGRATMIGLLMAPDELPSRFSFAEQPGAGHKPEQAPPPRVSLRRRLLDAGRQALAARRSARRARSAAAW